jgi:hypothetical protein
MLGLLLLGCGGRAATTSGGESGSSAGGTPSGVGGLGGAPQTAPTMPADAGVAASGPEITPGSEFSSCDPDGGATCLPGLACAHVNSPMPEYYLCSRPCDPTNAQQVELCWDIGGICLAAPGQPYYCVLDVPAAPGAAGWPCATDGPYGGSTCNAGLSCVGPVCTPNDRLCIPPDAGIDAGVLCGASFGCLDGECVSIR